MQGSTGQGNQNGQSKGGLSWTQSPSSSGNVTSNINSNAQGGAKPISQVGTSAMPSKAPQNSTQQKSSMPNTSSSSGSTNKNNNGAKPRGGARTAGIFIAGVIVGLIIGWGWFSLGRDNDTGVVSNDTGTMTSSSSETATKQAGSTSGSAAETGVSSSGSMPASGSNSLSVLSQSSGLEVTVSSVSVSAPTWVVIFEGVNGAPGNALGAKMFFPGQTSGTVDLLRATAAGKTYFAGEYVDNGDHQFSKQDDSQVNTVAGTPMLVQFTAR